MILRAFQTINNPGRNSSIDIFRCMAIVSVVLYHFNHRLAYGFLGVDLFFVISGFLIGGILTKEFEDKGKIGFWKFFLQRGFKIWPSYFAFLFFGNFIAWFFYHSTHPEQVIPLWDIKRYLFFYQNYTGQPFHWSFDHIWSLCVEEHFYILLPCMFLLVQYFVSDRNKTKTLFVLVSIAIVAGITFKFFSYYFTHSHDTHSATHNRLDVLAWGVLLNLVVRYGGEKLKTTWFKWFVFIMGVSIFTVALYFAVFYDHVLYENIYLLSIVPFAFFCMLLGAHDADLSRLKPLRFVAYYSYNWYLWHPVFVIFLTEHLGNTTAGLLVYLGLTFLVAMLATLLIEEPFLKARKTIFDRVRNKRPAPAP